MRMQCSAEHKIILKDVLRGKFDIIIIMHCANNAMQLLK